MALKRCREENGDFRCGKDEGHEGRHIMCSKLILISQEEIEASRLKPGDLIGIDELIRLTSSRDPK